MKIIERLQKVIAPQIFTPHAVYDGRKNLFAARELPFGPGGTHEVGYHTWVHSPRDEFYPVVQFGFTLTDPASEGAAATAEGGRGPKTYKVKLTHVATINPEVLSRFLHGKQSHDNTVLTAITVSFVSSRCTIL